jgi:hypothetical protein
MSDSSLLDNLDVSALRRPPRSPGLHMSTLLKVLYPHQNEAKTAKMDDAGKAEAEKQLRLYGMLGLAFEDRAELALLSLAEEDDWPWYALRPGEISIDGVAGSPDILLVPKDEGGEVRELSIKLTWKSSNDLPLEEGEDQFPMKFNYYIGQCKAYAKGLDTTASVLVCYFACGTWRPAMPQMLGWEFEFSRQEIDEEWDALMTIAQGIA